jgi:predicted amidohydrolase YtcJ
VLDGRLFDLDPSAPADLRVGLTMVDDTVVHQA